MLALVAAPLHAFALPRGRADGHAPPAVDARPGAGGRAAVAWLAFMLVAAAFAAYAFVPSGLSAHLLAIFRGPGSTRATVVIIGALFGPSQVMARIAELAFARNVHPLVVARFAVGLLLAAFALMALFGVSVPVAAAFMMMFGMANGLITIARGTVPLALFGAGGYGALIGRIAGPCLVMQAMAPLVLAFVAERASDLCAGVVAALALVASPVLLALRRPVPRRCYARRSGGSVRPWRTWRRHRLARRGRDRRRAWGHAAWWLRSALRAAAMAHLNASMPPQISTMCATRSSTNCSVASTLAMR